MNLPISLVLLICFVSADDYDTVKDDRAKGPSARGVRCVIPNNIPSSVSFRTQGRGRTLRYYCRPKAVLVGKRFATCLRGAWSSPPPICIATGCQALVSPRNGRLTEMNDGAMLSFVCDPGYSMTGLSILYCDGTHWNGTAPTCTASTLNSKVTCDFENPDLCGWSHDVAHDFEWIRNQFSTPSGHVGTGPSFDHTLGNGTSGHYMYLEASSPRKEGDVARLFSPVYPSVLSRSCFNFWYHMYGDSIGTLRIYLKGENQVLEEIVPLWSKQGQQGNKWLSAQVDIQQTTTTFQVIVEGVRANDYMGDIAIDDVRLDPGPCPLHPDQTLQGSCTKFGCNAQETELPGCSCSVGCNRTGSCCPDYWTVCMTEGNATITTTPGYNVTGMLNQTTTAPSIASNITESATSTVSASIPTLSTRPATPSTTSNETLQTNETTGVETLTSPTVALTSDTSNTQAKLASTPNLTSPNAPTLNVTETTLQTTTPLPTASSKNCIINPANPSLNIQGDLIDSFNCTITTAENNIDLGMNVSEGTSLPLTVRTTGVASENTTTTPSTTVSMTTKPGKWFPKKITSVNPTTTTPSPLTELLNNVSLTVPTTKSTVLTQTTTKSDYTTSSKATTDRATTSSSGTSSLANSTSFSYRNRTSSSTTRRPTTKAPTTTKSPGTKIFILFTKTTQPSNTKTASTPAATRTPPKASTSLEGFFTSLVDVDSEEEIRQIDDNRLAAESAARWEEFPRRPHPMSEESKNSASYVTAVAIGCSLGVIGLALCVYVIHYARRRQLMRRSLMSDSEMRFIPQSEEIEISLAENTDSTRLL